MRSASVAEAKARLSELLDCVQAGETVSITRRGKPIARIVAERPQPEPFDFDALKALTDTLPFQQQPAGEFIRNLRDADRY